MWSEKDTSHLPLDVLEHVAAIRAACARIASSWEEVMIYEPASPTGGAGGAGRSPLLPGGTARLSLIDDVPRVLSRWCSELAHLRPGSPPRPGGPGLSLAAPMLRFLSERAVDYAGAGVGLELAEELTEVADALAAFLAEPEARRVPVGPCPEPGCPGEIRAVLAYGARTDPPLVCSAEAEHYWPPHAYLEVAAAMGAAPPAPMLAPELAAWLAARHGGEVSARRVEQWARFHPLVFARDGAGRFDPVRVATWYVGRRAARA